LIYKEATMAKDEKHKEEKPAEKPAVIVPPAPPKKGDIDEAIAMIQKMSAQAYKNAEAGGEDAGRWHRIYHHLTMAAQG
jgi:hypothetical protein